MKKGFEPTSKKPKKKSRVTTVRDILAHDSVNKLLDELEQNKADIKDMVVVCIDNNDGLRFLTTEMTDQQIVYMLESAKYDILKSTFVDEDD